MSTPAEKKRSGDALASVGLPPVTAEQTTLFRSLVMRAQFLAQDRADLNACVKSLTRKMKAPNESDLKDLKRLARYLVGKPRVLNVDNPEKQSQVIKINCGSDHAGCLLTRKSTTGFVVTIGRHCVKHGSNLQSTIALSSGESGYYALVKAASIGLSTQALMADWNEKYDLVLYSDSSAARGTASRRGLGKLRHVQTRYLRLQERVSDKSLKIVSVGTHHNIISQTCVQSQLAKNVEIMKTMCQELHSGKAEGAKALESTTF